MLTLIFILAALIPYLAVGARFSRTRYAELTWAYANPDWEKLAANRERLRMLRSINIMTAKKWHSANCEQHKWDYYLHCNCGAAKNIAAECKVLGEEVAKYDGASQPSVVAPIFLWPAYKAEAYLKGGEVKKPNYSLIEALEKQELQ
jgi:hypothetical protein